ncbi:glycosyltransferase [Thermotoga sp. 38H-to]|jgi:glycosyltransferase involved in cell wall biosynthesis|uniref:glycosyltransferase n=1 Tax=Thermotoga sp. 38H-to TaxID=1755812 RepID=UPI0013EC8F44|nr:glycosyltransferase [Thermotoga sp. 38H-to]KAF2959884.1 glycosyl transferase family 1 [Thermotoga sp. 38H-to]
MIYISTFEDLEFTPGVRKKIYSQSRWFAHYTGENTHIILTKNRATFWQVLTAGKDILFSEKLFDVNGIFEKSRYYRKLLGVLPRLTADSSLRFKVAYTRTVVYDKHLLNLLTALKKEGFKIVLEIPTPAFVKEYINSFPKGWYKLFNFLLYHKKIYRLADLIVSIGEMSPVLKGLEDKVLVIGNGIDLNEIPVIDPPKFEKELHLIGVANVAYWHGYDRVIKGLWEYYRKTPGKKVYFHIVGDGPELPRLRKLTKKLELEEYVVFHGPKHGEELDKMFEKMHVGIGALGNHRKKLLTTSELKIREYCARGIPFVSASYDPDFPEDFPFLLRIPSDESPVDIQKVISFYKELKKTHPDYPLLMRKYAEEHLSWEIKMKPLVERIMEMR